MRTLRRICALAAIAAPLFADGGAVLSRQESGPFVITVFAAPVPLRAGPMDLTVMVQTRGLEPVLDAEVSIRLNGASEIVAAASRSKAQNKLLYGATFDIPRPGEWKYTISVHNSAGQTSISGVFQAGPPALPLASYAFYLAIPPALIGIFALHQWLSRREARQSRASDARCATIKP
jgi:hypothetical protein